MEHSKDLGFCVIYRNVKIGDKLALIFGNAYRVNKKYFPKEPKKFDVYVCDNKTEYRRHARQYYSEKSSAVAGKNNGKDVRWLAVRSLEYIHKIGKFKKKDFQKIIAHEVSHMYWYSLCKTWSPQWFVEGLACHVGNNFPLSKQEIVRVVNNYTIDSSILDYRYLRRNFKKSHFPRYWVWQAFMNYIMGNYSVRHVKRFIESYSRRIDKDNYESVFRKVFGKTDRELFNEFLDSIRIK